MCSWQTQGIYIKILCILHKQEIYGCILFKQNDKQKLSNINYFAEILVKNIPCQFNDMVIAIGELISNGVLIIDDERLYQKRMVKDGQISELRSSVAKKGGGNPILFKQSSKQKPKQKPKQNTEYEYEVENEDEIVNEYKSIINEWLKYKSDKKQNYASFASIKKFYKQLFKLSKGNYKTAQEIIDQSIASNWAGIFELKESKIEPIRYPIVR